MKQSDSSIDLDLWLDQSLISRQNQLKSIFWDILSNCAKEFPLARLSAIHSNSRGVKLTRGNDLNGFPYQVLDLIRDFDTANGLNVRVLNWYGHGLYLFILVGNKHPKKRDNAFITHKLKFCQSISAWDYPSIILNKNYINTPTEQHFDAAELFQWFTPLSISSNSDKTLAIINEKLDAILKLLSR